jgi:hypothetical protein
VSGSIDLTRAERPAGVALVAALRERIAELDAQVSGLERELFKQYTVLEERQVIAQAMGLLMSVGECAADQALVLLAERARSERRDIYQVASGVLAAHTETLGCRSAPSRARTDATEPDPVPEPEPVARRTIADRWRAAVGIDPTPQR